MYSDHVQQPGTSKPYANMCGKQKGKKGGREKRLRKG